MWVSEPSDGNVASNGRAHPSRFLVDRAGRVARFGQTCELPRDALNHLFRRDLHLA